MKSVPVALTVAGSDSGGGAGIQADVKTFAACGVFGTSVIVAVTAQNLDAVKAIQAIDTDVVCHQLQAVLSGFPIKAVKTGMLFTAGIIAVVAEILAGRREIPLVVDPVFMATSGSRLIEPAAVDLMKNTLFPLAGLITPNLAEAEALLGESLGCAGDLAGGAEKLRRLFRAPVLLKGGHFPGNDAVDVLADQEGVKTFVSKRIHHVNSHGSGCTFSAAITANLARGQSLRQAIASAKVFIFNSLKHSLKLQNNVALINHFWKRQN